MVRSKKPGLQVAEDEVDHGQVRFALVGIAVDDQRFMGVAEIGQPLVRDPSISAHGRAWRDVGLNEATKLLGAAPGGQWVSEHLQLGWNSRDDLQAKPTRIDELLGGNAALVRFFPLRRTVFGVFTGTNFDSTDDGCLMVHAVPLAARLAAYVTLVNLNWVFPSNRVTTGADHASAELVEDLEGCLVAAQAELPLELEGRHARRLSGHEVGTPKPCRERCVSLLHDRPSRKGHVAFVLAGTAAKHHRTTCCEAVGFGFQVAFGTREAVWPAQGFEVLSTRVIIWKDALKLGDASWKTSWIHVLDYDTQKGLCQVTGEAWNLGSPKPKRWVCSIGEVCSKRLEKML